MENLKSYSLTVCRNNLQELENMDRELDELEEEVRTRGDLLLDECSKRRQRIAEARAGAEKLIAELGAA